MKLQPASKKEIGRIALGSLVCLALMVGVFFGLSLLGVGTFDYTVILGGVVGSGVAVLNFALLCLTVQKVAGMENGKPLKARVQLSYHLRLIFQAVWIVVAFLVPAFHVLAAAIPLLFPTLVLYTLQIQGKLVTPSDRKDVPPMEEVEEEERLDTFEA